eukprot:scaffold34688_cov234-Amphora_coffeaeformis.AAC.1
MADHLSTVVLYNWYDTMVAALRLARAHDLVDLQDRSPRPSVKTAFSSSCDCDSAIIARGKGRRDSKRTTTQYRKNKNNNGQRHEKLHSIEHQGRRTCG